MRDRRPLLPHSLLRRRSVLRAAGALSLLSAGWPPAMAQASGYPNRPIKVVVPYSPGGSSDTPMRVIAQQLSQQMGQQVVVDNKPGMGAMVGTESVLQSAPDGYTLLLASNPEVISPALYRNLRFDPMHELVPISLMSREPSVLAVHPSMPVRTLAEFIAYVKQRPGQVDYASSGNGSAQHLFTAMFVSAAGLQMVHVPYKGSAQATTDLLGGQVAVGMPGLAAMVTHIREGKLRALAVTGERRSPLLPEVPTMAESGFADYSAYVWNGLMAPRGTPPEVVARLHREVVLALRSPAVTAYADKAAIELVSDTPTEFGAFLLQERDRMAKAVKDTGVSVD